MASKSSKGKKSTQRKLTAILLITSASSLNRGRSHRPPFLSELPDLFAADAPAIRTCEIFPFSHKIQTHGKARNRSRFFLWNMV